MIHFSYFKLSNGFDLIYEYLQNVDFCFYRSGNWTQALTLESTDAILPNCSLSFCWSKSSVTLCHSCICLNEDNRHYVRVVGLDKGCFKHLNKCSLKRMKLKKFQLAIGLQMGTISSSNMMAFGCQAIRSDSLSCDQFWRILTFCCTTFFTFALNNKAKSKQKLKSHSAEVT